MRTFEFSDAKSHKFWNIDVNGNSFTVTYGKIGTAGQTQSKSWPTPEKAQQEADKLVREKTSKGYKETTPAAATATKSGLSDTVMALEKAVVADCHDVAAWSAFADYLLEAGDPRGEFMRIQLALEDESLSKPERAKLTKSEATLFQQHGREWLGDLASFILDAPKPKKNEWLPPAPVCNFRRGWPNELVFSTLRVNHARAIRGEQFRFVQSIRVESTDYEDDFEPGPDTKDANDNEYASWHALARYPHFAALRSFHIGNALDKDGQDSDQCHMDGEFAYHILKQCPNIEEIYLLAHRVDAKKIFSLKMPRLRVLQMDHNRKYPLEVLAQNPTVANLERLSAWPHATDWDEDEDDSSNRSGAKIRLKQIQALARAKHLTKFTSLRLRLTDFGDKGVKEIIDSGMIDRLTVLDLTGGCITDEGADLLAAAPGFSKLKYVDLSQNALTDEAVKKLKAVNRNLIAKEQHDSRPPFNEPPEYLFYGDIE